MTSAGLPVRTGAVYLASGLLALVVYSGLWRSAPVLEGDSAQYMEVARDLGDFHLDDLHDRAPGYPLLLTLTGSANAPNRNLFRISVALHAMSVWLLALVLRAAGVGHRGLVAFGVLLMLPLYVEPAGSVMTENLAEFALSVGVAGLVIWQYSRRSVWLISASVALAYAGITRPTYQVLGFALAGGVLVWPSLRRAIGLTRPDAIRAAVALSLASIVIVGGLSAYNERTFGFFGVAPTLGFHLSTKTTRVFERLPDDYGSVRDILVRARDAELVKPGGTHDGTQAIWSARSELATVTGMTTPELSSYLVKMNLTLIRRAPMEYLADVGRALASYWLPATGPLVSGEWPFLRWLWVLTHVAVVLTLVIQSMVLAGAVMASAGERSAWMANVRSRLRASPLLVFAYGLAGAIVLYTMLLSCLLDIGEPRQRRPTDVLLVLMCFLGARLWANLRRAEAVSALPGLRTTAPASSSPS